MDRRVIRGRFANGSGGVRVSLPGFDAFLDDSSDPRKFSFDSDWTDIVHIHMAGTGHMDGVNPAVIPFADLGYKPFVEVRLRSGQTVYDDALNSVRVGLGATITTSQIIVPRVVSGISLGALDFVYVVYRVPVPTG